MEQFKMAVTSDPLVRLATPEKTIAVAQPAPSSDFINGYADYADVIEAPREMHEAVGMQLLATVLNRNGVTIPNGGLTYSLDLWLLLISDSGAGRSTLTTLPRPILESARLTDIQREDTWGSPQALSQNLADNPKGLFIWGEMSEKLKLLSDRRFGGAKQWLTDRYDNFKIPDAVRYRTTGKRKNNTPPIVFTEAPRINILATSSKDWFFTNLFQDDSTGGFIPRWMIIAAEPTGKVIPTPQKPDATLIGPLAHRLEEVSKLRGEVDLSAILPEYKEWYVKAMQRFKAQPNQHLAMAFFNRHRVNILKLAAIYEVSATASLHVTPESFKRAEEAAAKLEKTIFSLLPTGMSSEGFSIHQMEDRIRRAGEEGMSTSEFTRAFQHQLSRIREERIRTLEQTNKVVRFKRTGLAGRPPEYLVHEEFVDRYREKHPTDKPV
jgi:hypothetical protein